MRSILKTIVAVGLVAFAGTAMAEITATVRPGYQFGSNERPTTSTLNLLGTPSVLITGTLGGTNVAIGAGTISGTMLMDSVAGSNLTYDASTPRRLVIANSGVNVAQLAAAVAGNGLSGGAGSALAVRVDTKTIQITNDVLTVGTNDVSTIALASGKLAGGAATGQGTAITVGNGLFISGTTLTVSNFTTAEYALGSGTIANTNHNMGATPAVVLWRLICKTADLGYEVGDEVDVSAFYNAASFKPQFSPGANTTNLFLVEFSTTINVRRKDTGADDTITASRWKAIGRARQ